MALVQAIFATLPIAAKFVLPELGPTGIVFCRIAGSAIGFGALIQLSGAPKVSKRCQSGKTWPASPDWR